MVPGAPAPLPQGQLIVTLVAVSTQASAQLEGQAPRCGHLEQLGRISRIWVLPTAEQLPTTKSHANPGGIVPLNVMTDVVAPVVAEMLLGFMAVIVVADVTVP